MVFPKKMTSGEPERCHSGSSESPPDDPVSDPDSVELELPKLDALESEVCHLGHDIDPQE